MARARGSRRAAFDRLKNADRRCACPRDRLSPTAVRPPKRPRSAGVAVCARALHDVLKHGEMRPQIENLEDQADTLRIWRALGHA
jgi:hypothetical protein